MLAEAEADFERGDFIEVTDVRAYIEGIRDRAIERAKARQEEQARAVS
jgi:hypothetical protein